MGDCKYKLVFEGISTKDKFVPTVSNELIGYKRYIGVGDSLYDAYLDAAKQANIEDKIWLNEVDISVIGNKELQGYKVYASIYVKK